MEAGPLDQPPAPDMSQGYMDVGKNHLKSEVRATLEVNGPGKLEVPDCPMYRWNELLWMLIEPFGLSMDIVVRIVDEACGISIL